MANILLNTQELFQQVNAYAQRHGFSGGFPVFYEARYNGKLVYGAYFLHSAQRTWVPNDFLKDVQTEEDLFEAVNAAARTLGFSMGFPTYTKMQIDCEVQQEAVFLGRCEAAPCLVEAGQLGISLEDSFAAKLHKVQAYARSQGYKSGLPCGELANGKVRVQFFQARELTWRVLTETELEI